MRKTKLLDCTLRDGGYCNGWNFGLESVKKIILGLSKAKVDIIECGYLNSLKPQNDNSTLFSSLESIEKLLSSLQNKMTVNTKFACMINYGDFDIEKLKDYENGRIDCIRVAFHKKDRISAIKYCKQVMKKGFEVYVQPMVISDYSYEEIQELVNEINDLKPKGMYIVDSFGVMDDIDLSKIVNEIDNCLNDNIILGFHSHNNLQLSYSNAKLFVQLSKSREVIIDATIFGMGRGAGNLNTELFARYLNHKESAEYNIDTIITLYDEVISYFYNKKKWGYSLSTYLSATYNCHPNYASYLNDKDTLTLKDMDVIFSCIESHKKNHFDELYIESLYRNYLSQNKKKDTDKSIVNSILTNNVLIVAPGKSSDKERDQIKKYIETLHPVVISINGNYEHHKADILFVTNKRRARSLKDIDVKLIMTSNIENIDADMIIDYESYINDYTYVADNSILMLFSFLVSIGKEDVFVAGLDGYSYDIYDNYSDDNFILNLNREIVDKKNQEMNSYIQDIKHVLHIKFVTTEKYIRGN